MARSPRTILVFTRHTPLPWEDGAGAYLHDMLAFLAQRGHRVHVAWLEPHDHLRWQKIWPLPKSYNETVTLHLPGAINLGRRRIFPEVIYQPLKARTLALVKSSFAAVGIRVGKQHAPAAPAAPSAQHNAPVSNPWMAAPNAAQRLFAQKLIQKIQPDTIIANYPWICPLFDLPETNTARKICINADIAWLRAEQLARLAGTKPEITRDDEAALLSRADAIVGITENDATEFSKMAPRSSVILARKSVVLQPPTPPPSAQRLLFVGSANQFNTAGLHWFLQNVWPLLVTQNSALQLDVCGAIDTAVKLRPKGVSFHGRVDALAPFYRDASLVIVPLLQATGLNIKLVEAAAFQRPIIATPAVLAGAPFFENAIATAGDAPTFAEKILKLLNAPDELERLRLAAAAAVSEHLSPERCSTPLANYIESH